LDKQRKISDCNQLRIQIVDFLPAQAQMRQHLIRLLKFEIFLDVYIIGSTLIAKFLYERRPFCTSGKPQKTNEIFIAGVIVPFFVVKLIALNCCTSPQSVVS
jgi:hypothetical protein